ncbi:MFS transporter [Corynebacterium sp. SCR221107]|nr:MFS transporter [Corynebacterium sp. SCR221107]WBT08642.1 MFS transporter [Corynebacterium sp. SCR221107]
MSVSKHYSLLHPDNVAGPTATDHDRTMSDTASRPSGSHELPSGLRKGEPAYKRAVIATLIAGLATFNALYNTQAILPTLVADFHIDAATAALTISAATGALAIAIVPASILSEKFGRGRVLIISALLATLCGLAIPFSPSIGILIAMRALQGGFLAGVPAVAMTYLSEEIDARDLTAAMGIYIAGNSVGGITGRLIPAVGLEFFDWRIALMLSAVPALVFAIVMALILPKQRRFRPRPISPKREFRAMTTHWRNPSLAACFVTGFVALGAFVSLYNYMGFRLIHDFGLSSALVGVLFLMYFAGTWSAARAGRWTTRVGRGNLIVAAALSMTIGALLLLWHSLPLTLIGLFVFTAGFFLLHSLASSWVGMLAADNRAEGSSMYLFCYYVGSSVVGWLSGLVFTHVGWHGFVWWDVAWTILLIGLALFLRSRASRS